MNRFFKWLKRQDVKFENQLETLIQKFYENHPDTPKPGRLTSPEEFKNISKKVLKRIPEWYKNLLLKYPLAEAEIWIPNDQGDEEFIAKPLEELPLMRMTFSTISEVADNALNIFPDYALLKYKIIKIAVDGASQEGIFIDTRLSDPEVRLVFHDFGETGREVWAESELLLEKFSEIFIYGKRQNQTY